MSVTPTNKFTLDSLAVLVDKLVKSNPTISADGVIVHLAQKEKVSWNEYCYWNHHRSDIVSMTAWASLKNSPAFEIKKVDGVQGGYHVVGVLEML